MQKLFTCSEIAERYSIQLDTVWGWIRSGELPAVRIGRMYRVRGADLLAFEEKRMTSKVGPITIGEEENTVD